MSLLGKNKQTGQPNLEQLLSEFNQSLALIADKQLLIGNIAAKVKQLCPVEDIYFFLLDENTGKYKDQNEEKNKPVILTKQSRLVSWLSVNDKYLAVSSHPDIIAYLPQEEQSVIRELNAELIFPLKVMNRINGIIFVGKKTDGTAFSPQELKLLSILINQATFAIEHASLHELQTERLKKMYRADRLATLGELAAGAAHEIRNPLTAIRSTIQYLSKDFNADTAKKEMMDELISEVERINKIVQGLLSFARPSELNASEVNIEQLINGTLLLVTNTLRKQNVEVEFEYFADNTTIQADTEQLKQVFLNIILNAVEAMSENTPEHPRTLIISIEKGAAINANSRYLIISFEDTGKGIDRKDIENVFNPFFTTKEEGTGLGLAICYGIVKRHDGEIEMKSTPGKGTCINIKLPQRI